MTAKAALIVCPGLYNYFSPYHVCMRAENSGYEKKVKSERGCPHIYDV